VDELIDIIWAMALGMCLFGILAFAFTQSAVVFVVGLVAYFIAIAADPTWRRKGRL
jgi:preprotein translocase subunit Sss1